MVATKVKRGGSCVRAGSMREGMGKMTEMTEKREREAKASVCVHIPHDVMYNASLTNMLVASCCQLGSS